jgi:hypothetical protein
VQSVVAAEPLEPAHARNFLDAILHGCVVDAPLEAGVDASRPVQMALRAYWSPRTVFSKEFS